MQDLVNELKEKREELLKATNQVVNLQQELEQSELGKSIVQAVEYKRVIEDELKTIDTQLREKAIEHYQETGNKKPANGVNIIILKSLDYHTGQAIDWVIHNARDTMLKLDKRAFEKHAKAVADTVPLDFVDIIEKPSVRIAKDLS